jgi:octaprenyl-diphosphate synthase
MNPTRTPALPRSSALFASIAGDLEEVERVLKRTLVSARPGIDRLLNHLHHYRGKRLRPALLLLTASACGKVVSGHHVLAAVVEMIHTATLVHDDVLDSADVRRHTATVNAVWGNQTSILLGDYLFTHAFHLSSTLGDAEVCRLIGESTNRLCAGELHQVSEQGNLELTEEEYFEIIDAKTAELTACSCRLGALFSDATADVVDRLAEYGRNLGMAFQVADDLLDLAGEEATVGKSLGTDAEQQKLTLPLIYLLNHAPADQIERVRALLRAPGNHKRGALQSELQAAGALDYARQQAALFASQALTELDCLPPSPARTVLEHLTQRVVHRDR